MSEGIIGLAGVVIGAMLTSLFTWVKDWWIERKSRERRARYLAMRVVCILDKFVQDCVNVAYDKGVEDADGWLKPQVRRPERLSLPTDVDWSSVNHDVMYRALSLPSEVDIAENNIGFAAEDADDYEFFEERQYQYACLGLNAVTLARDLRDTYSIPSRVFGHWDPEAELQEKKDGIEKRRKERKTEPSIFDDMIVPNAAGEDELLKANQRPRS
jgi:hypothetical protein